LLSFGSIILPENGSAISVAHAVLFAQTASRQFFSPFISFSYSNGLRLITNFLWVTLPLYLYYYAIENIMNHL